ncbi:L,D-transpeptidase family protein [Rubritalea tangerina]|uniref:L,D-transpeptidase family protein n=1 Tax=Rubritalea tangerina TaxID=430798 RepID=A0ABW4ZB42_9BACT
MHILISINKQTLQLMEQNVVLHSYPISSAKNGIGFEEGSYQTPTGNFLISEKHGHDAPIHTIFKGRKAVDLWNPEHHSDQDLVTTRILWLEGLDPNNLNTKERYIYIHGTNHEDSIGSPSSCGCIRMRNLDIIELFDAVTENTPVQILP